MAQVRVKNGPAKGQTFTINEEPISIGREPTCGIQIMDKGSSRVHAEIFRIGAMCFIRDMDSRNGTYINDSKIEEELLREGDRIQIGATILVFEGGEGEKTGDADAGFEFSEDDVGNTLELKLEDLSALNVGEGDGSEAKRLRALYRLGRLLNKEKDEQSLIKNILPFVVEQLNADVAYLFTRDPVKGNIVPIGSHSKSGKKGGKISRSIIRRAIQEKRALLTSDAMQDNRFSARDSIVLKQIHSVICVPLSVSGDLSGVLYLAGDNPANVFSEEELELAAAMADQIGLAISHIRMSESQRETMMSTISVLVRASEMRDPTTRGHSERVASYSLAIGRQLQMSNQELDNLHLAALLHGIGKLAIGENSMYGVGMDANEKGASEEEKLVNATLDIIKDMACYSSIENGIRYQLECNDGSGPQGLQGNAVPLEARIIAVAKHFDMHANQMSQGNADTLMKDAVVEIGRQAGRKFDEDVVKALLIAHRNGSLHAPLHEQVAAARTTEMDKIPEKNAQHHERF